MSVTKKIILITILFLIATSYLAFAKHYSSFPFKDKQKIINKTQYPEVNIDEYCPSVIKELEEKKASQRSGSSQGDIHIPDNILSCDAIEKKVKSVDRKISFARIFYTSNATYLSISYYGICEGLLNLETGSLEIREKCDQPN